MFTGLIETICSVRSVSRRAGVGGLALTIDLGRMAGECKPGDSIAVNGACLTIAGLEGPLASFDLSAETLEKSTLGNLKSSSEVNIERAMKPTDRFGGHFVLGHVDGTATVRAIEKRSGFADMQFAAGPGLLEAMVAKGSVAVDGVSLTIASLDKTGFGVAIIPETLKRTTLGKAKIGDFVNVEADIIVKAVKRQLEEILPKKEPLTAERLRQLGF
ncbi:MAG: riboflavin synthase subunit alpha [Planctomycetes bacterium RBG_16_55_9]|nr:MAG: riboflavin synthase subunit alpha [Planctomycetes bacterium RBG_16_55_9]